MNAQPKIISSHLQKKRPSSLKVEQSTLLKLNLSQQSKEQPKNNPSSINNQQVKEEAEEQGSPKQLGEPKGCELLNMMLRMQQVPTRSYRQTIQQIVSSFATITALTDNLQQKVDSMLVKQQEEFVESYKQHMNKIKKEFQAVDKKIQQYENKIKYYENEGEMSHLVIKVNQLQEECKKLYKDISEKEKTIKDSELTIKVQKSELKRYEKQIKTLMRQKNQLIQQLETARIKPPEPKINSNTLKNNSPQQSNTLNQLISMNSTANIVFPTQFQVQGRQKNDISTDYNLASNQSQQQLLSNKLSQKSFTLGLSLERSMPFTSQPSALSKIREIQLKRELHQLKRKNQLLNSYQSYVLEAKTDMETFFVDCVNQIKQLIKIKKKINYCSFEDWKKQDKIQLLIKIISNDQILGYLYERLFKKMKLIANQGDLNDENKNSTQAISKAPGGRIGDFIQQHKGLYYTRINSKNDEKPTSTKKLETNQRKQKAFSHANRKISKHISENSILPKIHFHLEY